MFSAETGGSHTDRRDGCTVTSSGVLHYSTANPAAVTTSTGYEPVCQEKLANAKGNGMCTVMNRTGTTLTQPGNLLRITSIYDKIGRVAITRMDATTAIVCYSYDPYVVDGSGMDRQLDCQIVNRVGATLTAAAPLVVATGTNSDDFMIPGDPLARAALVTHAGIVWQVREGACGAVSRA